MAPSVPCCGLSSYPGTFRVLTLLALCALPRGSARAASPARDRQPAGAALAWSGPRADGIRERRNLRRGRQLRHLHADGAGAPADYAGKLIAVTIQWSNSANDYDLYIHKDSNSGPVVGVSADGAPRPASIRRSIRPRPARRLHVHVVYFAVTPLVDQYQGSASVQPKPVARTASYVQGGLSFSPSVRLKAPVARRDGEPSSRTDPAGNAYVAASVACRRVWTSGTST